MDIAAEKLITDLHRRAAAPTTASSARRARAATGTSGVRWVIDPLDGTVNYLYGLPAWAVSIAAEVRRRGRGRRGDGADARRDVPGGARRRRLSSTARPAALPAGAGVLARAGRHRLRLPRRAPGARRPRWSRALLPRVRDIRRGGLGRHRPVPTSAAGGSTAYFERGLNPGTWPPGRCSPARPGALTGGRPGQAASGELTVAAPPGLFEPLQELLEGSAPGTTEAAPDRRRAPDTRTPRHGCRCPGHRTVRRWGRWCGDCLVRGLRVDVALTGSGGVRFRAARPRCRVCGETVQVVELRLLHLGQEVVPRLLGAAQVELGVPYALKDAGR